MRKLLLAGTLAVLFNAVSCMPALSAATVRVAVDGNYVSFPDQQPYVNDASNRTMVPVRFVTEKLGATVRWNAKLQQVTITRNGQSMYITIGQNHAIVNGKTISLDAPAVIMNNRTMVPLRFISEAFGADVDWIAERNLVVVTTAGHPKAVPPASRHQPQKGTWIWDAAVIKTDQNSIFQFAKDNKLTTIYLHIDTDINRAVYQQFVRAANERQLKVEALGGNPNWALNSNQARIKEFITWVANYNAAVDPKERFQGLHFDIEPYLLSDWKLNKLKVIENWIDSMRFIEKETKATKIPVTLDVPFWVSTIKIPNTNYNLSAWLLEKFDCLVIMDYRNFAIGNDGIVENAKTMLREASTLKKQIVIAVDTAQSAESARTTFYSMSMESMEKELQLVEKNLSVYTSYAGIAVHDYKNWKEMNGKPK